MTLTTLIAQTRTWLLDPNSDRWTDAELTAWLNDAQDEFAIKTRATQTDATLSVNAKTPANAFYSLPADLIALTEVRVNGDELTPLSLSWLSCRDDWEADAGTPDGYLYGPYGQSIVRVWPYASGLTVKAFYVQQPAALVSGSDTPPFLAIYHKYLPKLAAAFAYEKDGEVDGLTRAQGLRAEFEEGVALAVASATSQPVSVPYRHV